MSCDPAASSQNGQLDLLTPVAYAGEVEGFRDRLMKGQDDVARFKLCCVIRDEVLSEHIRSEAKLVALDRVMSEECRLYREKHKTGPPRTLSQDHVDEWAVFDEIVAAASQAQMERTSILEVCCQKWGSDVVKHYGWVEHSTERCEDLRAAAHAESDRRIAFLKLAQLQNRRVQLGQDINWAAGPIEPADLKHLKHWNHQEPYVLKDDPEHPLRMEPLDAGNVASEYALDKFGLLTRRQTASHAGSEGRSTIGAAGATNGTAMGAEPPRAELVSSPEAKVRRRSQRLKQPLYEEVSKRSPSRKESVKPSEKASCNCPLLLLRHLETLANATPAGRLNLNKTFRAPFREMCRNHLQEFCQLSFEKRGLQALDEVVLEKQPLQRRALDLAESSPAKRLRSDSGVAVPAGSMKFESQSDESFREAVERAIRLRVDEKQDPEGSHGQLTAGVVLDLLKKCRVPLPSEALAVDQVEAKRLIEAGRVLVPIFTKCNQLFAWDPKSRPIDEFLSSMDNDLDNLVSVQVSSRASNKPSAERKTLREVHARFLGRKSSKNAWNLLDLRSPLPSFLPEFLMGENARLLHQVTNLILDGTSVERVSATPQALSKWQNVLEWATLSDGSNTAPHRDAHGFATWLTCQEGSLVFIWAPNYEDIKDWRPYTAKPAPGQWCYRVMRRGDCVYFPPGLAHAVARYPGRQTLILGGHSLLSSDIDISIRVLLQELEHPDTTNEEMGETTLKIIRTLSRILEGRKRRGRLGKTTEEALALFKADAAVSTTDPDPG